MRGTALFFEDPEDMVRAFKELLEQGRSGMEVYSPYHVSELDDLHPSRASSVSKVVFCTGVLAAALTYGFLYLTAAELYPFDVAGTPHHSWPAFLPVTFEITVLLSALAAFFSVLWFCGLPRFHHPVFDIEGFEGVTRDQFVIVLDGVSPDSLPRMKRGVVREY